MGDQLDKYTGCGYQVLDISVPIRSPKSINVSSEYDMVDEPNKKNAAYLVV
jgi:hypothetical protein